MLNEKQETKNPLYKVGFRMKTIYYPNQTITSWFNFAINVHEDQTVEVAPDGHFSDLSYVWGDNYHFTIFDKNGKFKTSEQAGWFTSVYYVALDITNDFKKTKIKVSDLFELERDFYDYTVEWYGDSQYFYKNGTDKNHPFDPQTDSFIISNNGLLKQYKDNSTSSDLGNNIKIKMILEVKDLKKGKVEKRPITIKTDENSNFILDMSEFGEISDEYVWNDDYSLIFDTEGKIFGPLSLIKNTSITQSCYILGIIGKLFMLPFGSKITLQSENNTLKLIDQTTISINPQEQKQMVSIFTNTNQVFSKGVKNTKFLLCKSGFLEVK